MPTKHEKGQKDRLALAVASGRSATSAAKALGIPERTGRRWANDTEFRRLVVKLRNQIMARAAGRLASLASKAAVTLGKLLESSDPEIRLKAARAILADGLAVKEGVRLEEQNHISEDEFVDDDYGDYE